MEFVIPESSWMKPDGKGGRVPANFAALYEAAVKAGRAAGEAVKPIPMVVAEADGLSNKPKPGGKSWFVSEGACGFAWVNVSPGNCAFANWLKKMGYARKAYGGGVDIWIGDYNQSIARKEAHASAMAKVFREAGIKAYSNSRLD